jgi:hypothetical protein
MGKQVVHGILPIKASSGFIVHVLYLVCLKEDTYFTASLQYGTVQQETLNKEQPTAQKASQTRN